MQLDELDQWLQELPLEEPVHIDGELVYLHVTPTGAELGATFLEGATDQQIRDALKQGFQNAIEFDAGWGISADGNTLLLTQWLPGVSSWAEVPEPLERLLNQVAVMRPAVQPATIKPAGIPSRDEQRARSRLMGE